MVFSEIDTERNWFQRKVKSLHRIIILGEKLNIILALLLICQIWITLGIINFIHCRY